MTKYKKNSGIALILSIMLMTLVLFLSIYFLNFTLSEKQISSSQSVGERAYYLAEAGVADMIWKVKNDATYQSNFESLSSWTTTLTRNNPFGTNTGSYSVTITNSSLAHADIVSTGTYIINGKTSQRVIKTKIYKPIGTSLLGSSTSFADGNVDISTSNVNYVDGNAHSDGVFNINGDSNVYINDDLEAVGNYNKNWQASVDIGGNIHAQNYPPAASGFNMPAVDFNSSATSSLKKKANQTYTPHNFENMLNHTSSTTLSGIIYVSGDVDINTPINLTINGLLVVDGDLTVGSYNHHYYHNDSNNHDSDYQHHEHHWYRHHKYTDTTDITVNSATGTPTGIMANGKIYIMNDVGNIYINGVLYATDYMTLENMQPGQDFTIVGGTASRKLTITSCSRILNFVYNNQILVDTIGQASSSPVVLIEHWEEEY